MIKHTETIRRQQPTNCSSVFDHFVKLVLKRLNTLLAIYNISWQLLLACCDDLYTVSESYRQNVPCDKRPNIDLHLFQCKELEAMCSASEKRLETLLHSESTTKGIVSTVAVLFLIIQLSNIFLGGIYSIQGLRATILHGNTSKRRRQKHLGKLIDERCLLTQNFNGLVLKSKKKFCS